MKRRLATCLGLLAMWFSGTAFAADARPVLVVTYRDNPPDLVSYCAGRHSGPLRYVIEEAAARVGHRVEWRKLNLANSLRALKEGSVDIVPYLFTKTSERSAIGRFSETLGGKGRTVSFLMRKNDSRNVLQFADLEGFVIGYHKDSYYLPEFHESPRLKTVPYERDAEMVKDFIAGTIDMVAVNNKAGTARAFLALGFNEYKYAEFNYKRDAFLYLLYSLAPSKQTLFDRFDRALAQMRQEGVMTDIYRSFDTMPLN